MVTENGELLDLLNVLVDDQAKTNQNGVNIFELDSNLSGEELLGLYLDTNEFRQTYSLAIRAALTLYPAVGFADICHCFAGKAYHDLSFMFASSIIGGGNVVLSPEKTFEFHRLLYPDIAVIRHPVGLDSIEGITVPDGLLVCPRELGGKILGIYEYTLMDNEFFTPYKRNHILYERRDFRALFTPDAFCEFIVPQDSELSEVYRTDIRVRKIPLGKIFFGRFIRDITSKGLENDPDLASIYDIIRYIDQRLDSTRTGLKNGRMSESDISFIRRYPDYIRTANQVAHSTNNG